jgi:hypothetical protein
MPAVIGAVRARFPSSASNDGRHTGITRKSSRLIRPRTAHRRGRRAAMNRRPSARPGSDTQTPKRPLARRRPDHARATPPQQRLPSSRGTAHPPLAATPDRMRVRGGKLARSGSAGKRSRRKVL